MKTTGTIDTPPPSAGDPAGTGKPADRQPQAPRSEEEKSRFKEMMHRQSPPKDKRTPGETRRQSPDELLREAMHRSAEGLGRLSPKEGDPHLAQRLRDERERARLGPDAATLAMAGTGGAHPAASRLGDSPVPTGVEPTGAGNRLDDLASRIADRILVSSGSAAGDAEVRITLKDNVLPGTEIVIRRDRGEMQIQFQVSDADTGRMLDGQKGNLQQQLSDRLNQEVRISVREQPTEGGTGDGRSRNRRDLSEEWTPEEN